MRNVSLNFFGVLFSDSCTILTAQRDTKIIRVVYCDNNYGTQTQSSESNDGLTKKWLISPKDRSVSAYRHHIYAVCGISALQQFPEETWLICRNCNLGYPCCYACNGGRKWAGHRVLSGLFPIILNRKFTVRWFPDVTALCPISSSMYILTVFWLFSVLTSHKSMVFI